MPIATLQPQRQHPVLLGRSASQPRSDHQVKTAAPVTSLQPEPSALFGRSTSQLSCGRQVTNPLPGWLCRLSSCLGLGTASVSAKKGEDDDENKIRIDRSTEVPEELYFQLIEAGRKARARGQHRKAAKRIVLSSNHHSAGC
eukprot:TRINITY_DN14097_c0_g1_i1.p1 TRINITY_DN14097_c0_g1~~TRINITY_DN14097_c0_g1_i1.p1  ORF type:complete len:142 (-),score=13.48 TRINITY_DN14097_c0_g1_i1:932-1357(-)